MMKYVRTSQTGQVCRHQHPNASLTIWLDFNTYYMLSFPIKPHGTQVYPVLYACRPFSWLIERGKKGSKTAMQSLHKNHYFVQPFFAESASAGPCLYAGVTRTHVIWYAMLYTGCDQRTRKDNPPQVKVAKTGPLGTCCTFAVP